MATCLNKLTRNMLKDLKLSDVMCPVCRGIFIEPVLMPCRHALCLQCFQRTMEENSLTCPLCRKRIGSWLRTNTKEHKLVHKELWEFIKKRFWTQVQAKLNGEDDGVEEQVIGPVKTHISSPGEIRKEYESHIKILEEETRRKLEAEYASEELVRKLQEEEDKQYLIEKQQLLKQSVADEQFAKELYEQSVQGTSGLLNKKEAPSGMDNKENKNSSRGSATSQIKGPMDSYIYSQKKLQSATGKFLTTSDSAFSLKHITNKQKIGSELEKFRSISNSSTGSHDSINQELHHFKPIKSVPRTPPKKQSDSRVLVPMVVKAVPINLNPVYDSHGADTYISSSCRQQLLKVQKDRIRSLKGALRPCELYPQVSAFRGKQFLQRSEPTRFGNEAAEIDQSEGMESPRKKSRQDYSSDEQKSSFSVPQLSSYSDKECKGKKVIAIVHNQTDVEGKIGSHDRRFGGSGKEENCSFNMVGKIRHKDDESEEESGDLDYEDPDVTRLIGVDPELNSQNFREATSFLRCSSDVRSRKDKISIEPADETAKNCSKPHHGERNNFTKKIHNNNDLYVANTNSEQQLPTEKDSSGRCNVDFNEILPFSDEDSNVLLTSEQAHIEKMIRQEQEDFQLALRLQEEWEKADRMVDRSKGSVRAYELRNTSKSRTRKKKKSGRGRQSTLEESFTGALHSSQK